MSEQTMIEGIDCGPLAPPANPVEELAFSASAQAGAGGWGIVQAPFMFRWAEATGFSHQMTLQGDTMRYSETTLLDICQRKSYEYTNKNTLRRNC